jgi:hypothetical protein
LTVIISAGTYFVTIEGFDSFNCGEYVLVVDSDSNSATPDFITNAPFVSPLRSTCSAGNDCPLSSSQEHIYQVVIPTDGEWIFSLCGADFDTRIYVGSFSCTGNIAFNDDDCGLSSEVTINITAGTYYVTVEGFDTEDCGNYQLSVEGLLVPSAPDYTETAPFTSPLRNTCTAGDDCFLSPSPEHVYEVVIPNSGSWIFSVCGASFDTQIFVGSSLCSQNIASNDDECGLASEVTIDIPAGTYYVTVEGFDTEDCGNYELTVEEDESTHVEGSPVPYSILVYPNPTNGLIHIDKGLIPNASYDIVDMMGKSIERGVLTGESMSLDMSSYLNGVYFLKVNNQTFKLIKQ